MSFAMIGRLISHSKIFEKLGEVGRCMVYKAGGTKRIYDEPMSTYNKSR